MEFIKMLRLFPLLALVVWASAPKPAAQISRRPIRIAFVDFGDGATGRRVANLLAEIIAPYIQRTNVNTEDEEFQVVDRDQTRAAALGVGYRGSLNMTLREARDLGSAIGCDFFFTGDAQTLRRSPSDRPAYFESYAAIYLVSARTGKLASWERPSVQRASAEEAETALSQELTAKDAVHRYQRDIRRALEDERADRAHAIEDGTTVVQLISDDDESGVNNGVQAPRPYRRLKPPYPESAARAEVEATVDVLVDIDAQGEVGRVEIARWAGSGLDQAVIDTVRQLHFFPAMRDGLAIPMRVLLRYNFRKPPVPTRQAIRNRLR
jgi:TonB family protein